MIKHPAEIRIGDTVIFDVPSFANSIGTTIDNTYTLTWYGRTNTTHKGAAVTAANQGDGWRVTISSSTTETWVAGTWFFQLVAVSGSTQYLAARVNSKPSQVLPIQASLTRLMVAAVRKLILIKYRLPSERFLTVARSRVTQLLDAICRSMS